VFISSLSFRFLYGETVNIFHFIPILDLIKTRRNKAIVTKLMKRDPPADSNEVEEINIKVSQKELFYCIKHLFCSTYNCNSTSEYKPKEFTISFQRH